jgi:hypothetical protein
MPEEYDVCVVAIPRSLKKSEIFKNQIYWVTTVAREDDADAIAQISANILTGIRGFIDLTNP